MGFYDDSCERPIIIFGASILGEVALTALELCGLKPVCFGDNNERTQEKLFRGYPIKGVDEICKMFPDATVVIGAGRYYTEIRDQLSARGYQRIYNDADVIDSVDFATVPYDKIKGIAWRLAQLGKLPRMTDIPEDSLHLERLNIVVTERCTLNCRHCSSLMPFYKKPEDLDVALLLKALDRILSCADFIYHMEVLGGEPFLHKGLNVIMEKLQQYDNIFQIDVITNGTILPDADLIKFLKHDNICVVINDYGVASKKKETIKVLLDKSGIKNRLNKHWAWANMGGFESRNLPEKQLENLFARCNFNSCSELLNGKLYRCPRSSHGTNTRLLPEYKEDFIDVFDMSASNDLLKKRLSFFYDKQFIHACNHCNGNTGDSLKLTPAEQ